MQPGIESHILDARAQEGQGQGSGRRDTPTTLGGQDWAHAEGAWGEYSRECSVAGPVPFVAGHVWAAWDRDVEAGWHARDRRPQEGQACGLSVMPVGVRVWAAAST